MARRVVVFTMLRMMERGDGESRLKILSCKMKKKKKKKGESVRGRISYLLPFKIGLLYPITFKDEGESIVAVIVGGIACIAVVGNSEW